MLYMHINFYFQFQCESVVFTKLNLLANKVMLLARFFLQRVMFIKFISIYATIALCLYSTFCGEICHFELQKEPSITLLDFWLIS